MEIKKSNKLLNPNTAGCKIISFLMIVYLLFPNLNQLDAQSTFQLSIGGEGNERAYSIVEQPDGGYYIGGFSNSYSGSSEDAYLIKLNASFEVEWSRTFGGPGDDRINAMTYNGINGGLIITGQTTSFGTPGNNNLLLGKLSDDGTIQWMIANGGQDFEVGEGVVQLPNGEIMTAGISRSWAVTGTGAYHFKTTAEGTTIFGNIYDNTSNMAPPASDNFRDIVLCNSGDYVYMTGMMKLPGRCAFGNQSNNFQMFIMKTDLDGNEIWHTFIGGGNCREVGNAITQTADGNIVATGFTQSFSNNNDKIYLTKVDAETGGLMWTRVIGGTGDEIGIDVISTNDGGAAITGWTESGPGGHRDVFLLKTNSNGDIEWSRTYGTSMQEEGHALIQTEDNGYLIAGYTTGYGNGGEDIFLIKTDAEGRLDACDYDNIVFSQTSGGEVNNGIRLSTGHNVSSVNPTALTTGDSTQLVNCCPEAEFEFDKGCPGDSVIFSNLSEGEIISWYWDFGDGNTSNYEEPVHFYTNAGTYEITLEVSDANGCTDIYSLPIVINEIPIPFIEGESRICAGEISIFSTGPDGYNYVWNTGDNSQEIQIIPITDTVLSVILIDENDCEFGPVTMNILVDQPLEPELNGDLLICRGDTTLLSVTPSDAEIFWSTGESGPVISLSPEEDTELFVIISQFESCTPEIIFFTLEILDGQPVEIIGPSEICKGDTAVLTAIPSGLDYEWSTGDTSSTISISPEGDTTLFVIINQFEGCTPDTIFFTLEILEGQPVDIIGPTEICKGDTAVFTAIPSGQDYEWSTGDTSSTISISPDEDTVLFVRISQFEGCTQDTIFFTLGILEKQHVDIIGPAEICKGDTAVFTAMPYGQDYEWSTGDTSSTISISPEESTDLFVRISQFEGCTPDTIFFTLEILEGQPVDIIGPTEICEGDTAVFNAIPTGLDYQWSTGDTSSTISISPDEDTDLFLWISQFESCTPDTIFFTLEILKGQAVDIIGPSELCKGDTAVLTAMPSGQDYEWSTGDTSSTISISPEEDTDLFVRISQFEGCTPDTVFFTLVILEGQPVDLVGPTEICEGDTAVFNAIPTGLDYEWSTGDTSSTISISPDEDTELFVRISQFESCTPDTIFFTLEILKGQAVDIVGPTEICEGDTAVFYAIPTGLDYEWSTGDTSSTISISPDEDTELFVRISQFKSCTPDTLFITLEILEGLVAEIEGPGEICKGDTAVFTALPGGLNYEWSTGETDQIIQINPEADLQIRLIASNAHCKDSVEVGLRVLPIADIQINEGPFTICPADSLELMAISTNCFDWNWGGDHLLSCHSCESIIVYPEVEGIITLSCANDTVCFNMVSIPVFIDSDPETNCFICKDTYVYLPNAFSPNDDGVNDRFFVQGTGITQILKFEIYCRWGNKVFSVQNIPANTDVAGWDGTQNGNPSPEGVYLYSIQIFCRDKGTKIINGDFLLMR